MDEEVVIGISRASNTHINSYMSRTRMIITTISIIFSWIFSVISHFIWFKYSLDYFIKYISKEDLKNTADYNIVIVNLLIMINSFFILFIIKFSFQIRNFYSKIK